MKRIRILYSSFLFLLLAYSCQQKEEDNFPSFEQPIRIIGNVLTRSAMESGFNAYDEIGVFMLNRTNANIPAVLNNTLGNWLDNGYFQLESNGQTWLSLAPIFWKDENTVMDVIAYYPYIDMSNQQYNATSVPFSVQTDQQELARLRSSDFLYAEEKGVNPQNTVNGITLGFKHKLCKLTVQLKFNPAELIGVTGITVKAHNVNYRGTVNLSNGAIYTNTEAISNISLYVKSYEEAKGILFPQQIPAGRFLTVTLNGLSSINYSYTLNTPLTLEEGKEYIVEFDCSEAT